MEVLAHHLAFKQTEEQTAYIDRLLLEPKVMITASYQIYHSSFCSNLSLIPFPLIPPLTSPLPPHLHTSFIPNTLPAPLPHPRCCVYASPSLSPVAQPEPTEL